MPIVRNGLVELYSELHRDGNYGSSSVLYMDEILACIIDLKPSSVLEYGCGQSALSRSVYFDGIDWDKYDPAIDLFSVIKKDKYDFIVNTDVMEHIPESDVVDVLKHMKSYSDNIFFSISCRPARRVLPDGNNPHCTIWSSHKWLNVIKGIFPYAECPWCIDGEECIIVTWNSPVKIVISKIAEGTCCYSRKIDRALKYIGVKKKRCLK